MISQEEFNEWLQHPVTLAVRRMLEQKRAGLRDEWEHSDPTAYTQEAFVLASVGNIGWCRGLAFAQTLDYETYLTEIDDGESERAGPPRSSGPNQDV